jgi:nicotinamidase-related amidase
LTPDKTALLLLDFQRDIIAGSALATDDPEASARIDRAVTEASTALSSARTHGMIIVHVRVAFAPEYAGANPHSLMMTYMRREGALIEGAPGTAFDPRVEPLRHEAIVTKRGIGAFSGTDLDPILRGRAIEQVVLMGLVTHFVVYSTAIEAHDRCYRVTVLRDCTASATPERYESSLASLHFVGTVSDRASFAQTLEA